MPIQTDLSVSPYFDDYNENKDFYKVLFRPGVSVQARELNQLQTILQKQIERFGDNIFKAGTIINGCSIIYHSVFPYVKIKDNQTDGAPVNVNQFANYYVKNQANLTPLVAKIATSVAGFESQYPDLNTLYVKYLNTGFANVGGTATEQLTFSANQTLTVYDPRSVIESITSYNDSSGFANTDNIVILSAIAIQNSSGGTTFANNFYVNDYVGSGAANVQIVEIDTVSNSEVVILRCKPRPVDLQAGNTDLWTFTTNTTIQSSNVAPSSVATIKAIIGSGATAALKTGAQGEVDSVTVTSSGSGYYVLPTVSVSSASANTQQISNANLVPQNYLTQITVANNTSFAVGSGYAITVTPGVVYQKGYFSRVAEQLVVVDKYSNTPDAKAVGFFTTEEIINSNQDQSLLDNATGEPNYVAPGANRLKLSPSLVVVSTEEAQSNTEFFSIVEFSDGNPYKQNRQTFYNVIGDELARRTSEESGNYVTDQFIMTTKFATSFADEETSFRIQIDPGKGYINGYRVETVQNYTANVSKGINTFVATNAQVSLNYGNYIRVNELGGVFKFNVGDLVSLYPNAATYLTSTPGATPSTGSLGTSLGTARIRSLVLESGVPGTPEAVYRLYLFDVRVATARNFSLVRSIYYNGTTHKGVADAVLEGGAAVLKDNNLSALVYSAGVNAVKNSNNLSYVYRTANETDYSIAANGILTFTASGSETFPYTNSASLSTDQEKDLHIMPIVDVRAAANLSGSLSCNTTSTQVNGSSTSFTTELQAGDFIRIANSTANVVVQVNNITNNTVLFVKSNPATAFTGANLHLYFPKYVPISLERSTRSANVNAGANTLTVNLGMTLNAAANVAIAYNVRTANTQPVAKTVSRNKFVRIRTANNAGSNAGPWALGVTDVIRLSKVYKGPNATFTDSDTVNVTDVTNDYYIDHNQNENYYGISYLYKKPNSASALANTEFLLVKFDYMTHAGEGLKTLKSYNVNDTANLASSTTTINTIEIPEVFTDKGVYYDLRDSFDIRPSSANTVTPNASAASAPINPGEPSDSARFTTADKKFPAPNSNLTGVIEHYQGRVDRVVVDKNGRFNVIKGTPGSLTAPAAPNNALSIQTIYIPPYPSYPQNPSARTTEFLDNSIANQRYTKKRYNNYKVISVTRPDEIVSQQPRGYTMVDIGSLDRRIAALEYYTLFTLTEVLVQKKVIPSSVDQTMDRFKFGFFVDGFSNYNYADRSAPSYRAAIIDGCLTADVKEVNLPVVPVVSSGGDPAATLPLEEVTIISQLKATDGAVPAPPAPPTTGPNTAVTRVTSFSWTPTTATINSGSGDTATFQYIVRPTTVDPDTYFVEISVDDNLYGTIEGNTVTVQSAVGADVQATSTITGILYQTIPGQAPVILSRSASVVQNKQILGPVYPPMPPAPPVTPPPPPVTPPPPPQPNTFNGSISATVDSAITQTVTYNYTYVGEPVVVLNSADLWATTIGIAGGSASILLSPTSSMIYNSAGNQQLTSTSYYITGEQTVDITVSGLKPSTPHSFLLDGSSQISKVKSSGGILGGGITTDANGTASVRLYYSVDLSGTSDLRQAALNSLLSAGIHSIEIASSDGFSRASTTISIPDYAQKEIQNYATVPTITAPPVVSGPTGVNFNNAAGTPGAGGGAREFGINQYVDEV